jgi:hypothetical protein
MSLLSQVTQLQPAQEQKDSEPEVCRSTSKTRRPFSLMETRILLSFEPTFEVQAVAQVYVLMHHEFKSAMFLNQPISSSEIAMLYL